MTVESRDVGDFVDVVAYVHRQGAKSRRMAGQQWRRGHTSKAVATLGSFDRLPFLARRWWGEDRPEAVRREWPGAWTSSEPDDTDPTLLELWREMSADGRLETVPLPAGDPLTVYRGQGSANEPLGLAWSLERHVAEWFARRSLVLGAAGPAAVVVGRVDRAAVMGYITDRNEAEVIVDPADVVIVATEFVATVETLAVS